MNEVGVNVASIVHFVTALSLIGFILIQDPKGGSSGMFGGGGGSNSLFGATGAPTFLTRLTTWLAIIFAITSISITIFMRKHTGSVVETMAPSATAAPVETAIPKTGVVPTNPPASAPTGKLGEVVPQDPSAKPGTVTPDASAPATPGSKSH